ncbi:hypothetical protein PMG11_11367 [Penicillium brasilianum]|uniref:Uncharacterized protein n=1 Tax=Penicillium brasilianum TaxID=104259 RepID=A0A0F7U5X1_PENBI|nr:hypothetical protein PMG11_11367 [Penicillium brasilianum]
MECPFRHFDQLLGKLPPEIWQCVLDILDCASHSSLKAAVLCSSNPIRSGNNVHFLLVSAHTWLRIFRMFGKPSECLLVA